jgi:hypothetical protein
VGDELGEIDGSTDGSVDGLYDGLRLFVDGIDEDVSVGSPLGVSLDLRLGKVNDNGDG